MNLFDPKSWEWWQRIRSTFSPSEEESRPLGDPKVSPVLRDLDLMEPTDLAALHYDEHGGQIFDLLHFDGCPPCTDEPAGSESHHDQTDHYSHHAHEHHDHDAHGNGLHDHQSSWDCDGHCTDWGSSWD
jgi:hypothetical protein